MLLRIIVLHAVLSGITLALRRAPPRAKLVYGPQQRHCARVLKSRRARHKHKPAVIGGALVDSADQFPFLVWLGDHDGTGLAHFCGGSLIADRVVLTAAHCLYESEKKNAQVYARVRLTDFSSESGVERGVINWMKHTQYNGYTMFHDVALLLLNESVPLDLVTPVSLSDGTKDFEKSGEKEIVGWGSTDEQCAIYDTLLRRAKVPLGTEGTRCRTPGSEELAPDMDFNYHRQLCAGLFQGNMRYPGCGDSGGPLLAQDNGTWTQVGLVSWTYGVPYPDVFTRVSAYRSWIQENTPKLVQEGRRRGVEFEHW